VYEDWTKFGAVRGLIGGLLAALIILLSVQGPLDIFSMFAGSVIAMVIVAGMYTLFAYALGDTLAKRNITGWKALFVIATLVGVMMALIVLAIPSPTTDMSAPGTAVAYGYQYVQTQGMNMPLASVSLTGTIPKDMVIVFITSIVGELMIAFFTAGIYRVFNTPLPEV